MEQQAKIARLRMLTELPEAECRWLLERNGWDIDVALNAAHRLCLVKL